MMPRNTLLIAALALPCSATQAQPDPLVVRGWAAACFNCHGTNGQAVKGHEVLAGKDGAAMLRTLLEFKNGTKPATLMHQLTRGYSDEQLGAISAWFAAQPPAAARE